ncbi:MAG: type II toxin-antitoxin system VapC family toxin [Ignavibacteriales bacterium]|nr:type II toxin-antitoxin system VapC family toxin [Ignavibacteriales bacterium]
MEETIVCDTNIIIEVFKKNHEALSLIEKIGKGNISISAVTLMELYFGALNKKELERIKKSLSGLTILSIHESTTSIALNLIESFSKSHGLTIPDALIASTAIDNKLPLLTYNTKDFKFIKNLQLVSF